MISHGLLEMILNETMPPSVGTISVGRITTKSSLEACSIVTTLVPSMPSALMNS